MPMDKFEPLRLTCNLQGGIQAANERAQIIGFAVGGSVIPSLADDKSKRAWMQMAAEVNSLPYTIGEFSPVDNQLTISITLSISGQQFACEGYVKNTLDPTEVAIDQPNGVLPSLVKHVQIIGVCISSEKHRSSFSKTVEHQYLYDMAMLSEESKNLVIATDLMGHILYYNDVVVKVLGWPPYEYLGKLVVDATCSEDNKEQAEEIMENMRRGLAWKGSFTVRDRNGRSVPLLVTNYPLLGHSDNLVGIVGVSSVDQRENNDKSSQRDRLDHPNLFDPKRVDCILKENFKGILLVKMGPENQLLEIVWCNNALLTDLSLVGSEQGFKDLQKNGLLAYCEVISEEFTGWKSGVNIQTKGGKRIVEVLDIPYFGDITILIFEDATIGQKLKLAIQKASEEADSNAFKTDFITTMSHEMRTPLHGELKFNVFLKTRVGIIAETDNLEWTVISELKAGKISQELFDVISESLYIIGSSSRIQLHLVNNLLDYQKFNSRKVLLDLDQFDLAELIQDSVHNTRCLLRLQNSRTQTNISNDVPKSIYGDKFKVAQILTNYLDNAIKYSGKNAIIKIDCFLKDNRIVIGVHDNGPGIPPEKKSQIFQKFSRLNRDVASSGTGLGLSICQEMATLMGGQVDYSLNDMGGSSFWLIFPVVLARKNQLAIDSPVETLSKKPRNDKLDRSEVPHNSTVLIAGSSLQTGQEEGTLGDCKTTNVAYNGCVLDLEAIQCFKPVLIVEDNRINQKVLARQLMKLGFKKENLDLYIANDGVEALEMYQQHTFGLIFMDMRMPRMDGVEATQKLRDIGCLVPIVGISANALDEHRVTCLNAGMNDFLVKPVQLKQLEESLYKVKQSFGPMFSK